MVPLGNMGVKCLTLHRTPGGALFEKARKPCVSGVLTGVPIMGNSYRKILEHIRMAFPQPVSGRVHDSYFVHSIMRASEAVDTLIRERPILGERGSWDYVAARNKRLEEKGSSVETVPQDLVEYCSGLTLWGHSQSSSPAIAVIIVATILQDG